MTGFICHLDGDTATVAADTRVTYEAETGPEPRGLVTKFITLPHFNAVLAGGTWMALIRRVAAVTMTTSAGSLDELRAALPDIIGQQHEEFAADFPPERYYQDPEAVENAGFFLIAPGAAWFYGSDFAFQEKGPKRGPALFGDPPLDGQLVIPEVYRGDAHALDLLRRQRAQHPERRMGGPVVRARLTPQGIATATIGDLDNNTKAADADATAGLTRQQRRRRERERRKAGVAA